MPRGGGDVDGDENGLELDKEPMAMQNNLSAPLPQKGDFSPGISMYLMTFNQGWGQVLRYGLGSILDTVS